eukprot:5627855-Pyramimonas_sp.AAC.2
MSEAPKASPSRARTPRSSADACQHLPRSSSAIGPSEILRRGRLGGIGRDVKAERYTGQGGIGREVQGSSSPDRIRYQPRSRPRSCTGDPCGARCVKDTPWTYLWIGRCFKTHGKAHAALR